MNSEILSKIKTKLKEIITNKEVLDVILFGSVVKGKSEPRDIDIAIISEDELNISLKGFHISQVKPKEFFINPPTIITTLLREGYSLKYKKYLAESLRFENKVLFYYTLEGLNPSEKVRAVNFLRGDKGIIQENKGVWLANQVFTIPIESENLIEKFLINSKIKFKKSFVLMH